jgi:hypothetical protein
MAVRRIDVPRRRWPIVVAGSLAVLILVLSILSGLLVDALWFREVQLSSVFWGVLWTRVGLALVFGLLFFLLLYANLLIVRRITPRFPPMTPDQEIVERYRAALEPSLRWVLPVFSAVIALLVGLGVASQWELYILWRNSPGVGFGIADPVFERDPAFYLFSFPWLRFVQGWLFSALVGVTVIVSIAHYLWGGIRPQAIGIDKVTPQVKAHLSVLLGVLILVKAWGYRLGQFDLMTSPRGVVSGPSYTDLNAQLPALRLLVVIAIVCAVLFFVNIRFRGWALPVAGVGLLALASVVVGAAFPAAIQRFQVAPQELQRERPFIEDNIRLTRFAYGLDRIQLQGRGVALEGVTPEDAEANEATLANTRVWRPEILRESFQGLQRIRQYYEFEDVDVDRYDIDGERRVVMLSAREVSQDGIPSGGGTWQNRHLVYTHGFGAVVAQINTATSEGAPLFILRDIPPVGEPGLDEQPRVYYGERQDVRYLVVRSGEEELDYQGTTGDESEQVTYRYEGEGGIPIGGFFQRLLFSWHYRDVNLAISGLIQGDSRIMIHRDIRERIDKAAPFLTLDDDPYAAIVDGRIVWIQDAYTTSAEFPYSEEVELTQATGGLLAGRVNYLRNSVKVVVDAYDGTMRFYVVDEEDPVVQVWRNAFPDLFVDGDQASASLRAHFRYPENLLQVQAWMYANYHVLDPDVFYQKQDFWQIPEDPTGREIEIVDGEQRLRGEAQMMRPYYLLMKLPEETEEEFVQILPFTPQGRQNMVAWMAAKSDPEGYGEVIAFEFPTGTQVDGPTQAFARINQDPTFSAERTLLSSGGSQVRFGDLLVIPIEDALMYVQPVYVRSAQAETQAIPELKRVLVVNAGRVGIGNTLLQALNDSFSGEPTPVDGEEPPEGEEPPPEGEEPPGGTVDEQVAELLNRAAEAFAGANAALRDGDLATYQREIEEAQRLIERAIELTTPGG